MKNKNRNQLIRKTSLIQEKYWKISVPGNNKSQKDSRNLRRFNYFNLKKYLFL